MHLRIKHWARFVVVVVVVVVVVARCVGKERRWSE